MTVSWNTEEQYVFFIFFIILWFLKRQAENSQKGLAEFWHSKKVEG